MRNPHFRLHITAVLLPALAMLIASACSRHESTGTQIAATSAPPVKIERLDILTAHYDSIPEQQRQLLTDSMAQGIDVYLGLLGMEPGTYDRGEALANLSQTRPIRVFAPDVEQRLNALGNVEHRLGEISARLGDVAPKAKLGRVFGVVTPYRQGVITADSVILVSLNLYLGEDYPGYRGFEEYMRSTRRLDRLPYELTEGVIAAAYPPQLPLSPTLLQQMLYQGALLNATLQSMGENADLAEALGITPQQLKWLEANEANLWKALIDKSLLYSTAPIDATRLLQPSTSTSSLHPQAPGRAGLYLGYKIVKSYLDNHPQTAAASLLAPQFYTSPSALVDSQYAPKNR